MTDEEYIARDNAYTLAKAEEIKSDLGKLAAATAAAKQILKDEEQRLKGLQRISGKKVSTITTPQDITPSSSATPLQGANTGAISTIKFGIGKQPGTW